MHFSRPTVRETNTIGKPLPMSWPAARIFRAISFEALANRDKVVVEDSASLDGMCSHSSVQISQAGGDP